MQFSTITSIAGALAIAGAAGAQVTPFDFQGNGGSGLLPTNEVGTGAETSGSTAFGGETGGGLSYDSATSTLSFEFEFEGLTGGLANAAGGIHFHIASPGVDPFNETGGIALNLNSGSDPNVSLTMPLVPIGSSSGTVAGSAILTSSQETDLFAGRFYLNIHSAAFGGGELRGNLVEVPGPGALSVLGLAGLAGFRRRRGLTA